MPSPRHDAMTNLFRDRPQEAAEIIRSLGVELIDTPLVQQENSVFNTRPSDDLESDLVLVFGPPQQPLYGIAVEPQGDKSKNPVQLARYAAAGWLQVGCPFYVLVVTHSQKVADYYAAPVSTGLPGYRFRALVLGPKDVPAFTDPKLFAEHPVLAAFAVAIHGRDPEVRDAYANSFALQPSDYPSLYNECVYHMSPRAIQLLLEEDVTTTHWLRYSPLAKEHYGRGQAEGRDEGLTEGRAEGRAQEAVLAIIAVLEAREITVPDDLRDRISACTDLPQLERWVRKAAVVDTVEQFLD